MNERQQTDTQTRPAFSHAVNTRKKKTMTITSMTQTLFPLATTGSLFFFTGPIDNLHSTLQQTVFLQTLRKLTFYNCTSFERTGFESYLVVSKGASTRRLIFSGPHGVTSRKMVLFSCKVLFWLLLLSALWLHSVILWNEFYLAMTRTWYRV